MDLNTKILFTLSQHTNDSASSYPWQRRTNGEFRRVNEQNSHDTGSELFEVSNHC
jgi:hypothetical protein